MNQYIETEEEVHQLFNFFTKINKEFSEDSVDLSDSAYYAEQIFNINDEQDFPRAEMLAEQMAELAKKLNDI